MIARADIFGETITVMRSKCSDGSSFVKLGLGKF